MDIRLRSDAIVEALIEVRFEHNDIADVLPFKVLTSKMVNDNIVTRMPVADIPLQIRRADPALKFQPWIEVVTADKSMQWRVGENVVSHHVLRQYPGWGSFQPSISDLFNILFNTVRELSISRIGLRYVNIFKPENHKIDGVNDTNISINIAQKPIVEGFNLNYKEVDGDFLRLTRVATPDFVSGPDANFSLLIDIDVSTANGLACRSLDEALTWVEGAHDSLKRGFFSTLPADAIKRLAEA